MTAAHDSRVAPKASSFSWPSPEVVECPYPFYGAVRAEGPVIPHGESEYLVSRWSEIAYVLEHQDLFGQIVKLEAPDGHQLPETMVQVNPPQHWRQRKLGLRLVARDRLRAYAPMIRRIVDQLIDTFEDAGETEFYSQFADPLPSMVVCDIFGLPLEDLPFLRRIDEREGVGARFLDEQERAEHQLLLGEQFAYFRHAVEERLRIPRDDALTDMLKAQAERDGAPDLDYVASEAAFVFRAGNVTTTHMTASAMLLLLQDTDLYCRVSKDPSLIPQFLEEAMRLESPVQFVPRLVKEDTTVGGVPVPKGATLLLLLASGNRDDDRFPDADRVAIERPSLAKTQLAFGRGGHLCLGAPLARLEGRIAFERLFARLSNLRLAPGRNDFSHIASYTFRAPRHVWVEFTSEGR